MTAPLEPTVRPRGGGPSPELVGGLLVLVVLAVAATTLFGGRPSAPRPGAASPSPSVAAAPSATRVYLVDRAVADLLIKLNDQILDSGDRLTAELERDPFRPADVSAIVRELNASSRFGVDAVANLGSSSVALSLIDRLGGVYTAMREVATATLRASINNASAYRSGGEAMIEALAELPALQERLEELREGTAPPTPSPSAASPRPTATTTPEGTATPSPSAPGVTVSPSSAAPTASTGVGPMGPSQIVNGGFEGGVGLPWALRVDPRAAATIEVDQGVHAAGSRSARIEIATTTPAFGSVTLQQGGLRMAAGGRYTVRVSLRAAESREVRIYLVSRTGETYLTRVATAGPDWSVATYTFTAPVSDTDAVLEIGLGRTPVTTWVDEVWLSVPTP